MLGSWSTGRRGAAVVEDAGAPRRPMTLWSVPEPDRRRARTHFVDLAARRTVADVLRATGAGLRSVEHVKRYTTIGTAHDQGKTSGRHRRPASSPSALGADVADARARRRSGRRTPRSPSPPSPDATAARCTTRSGSPPIHDWHVAHGAEFEDVGQWKRPWYYPRAGEDMEQAVLRECRGGPRAASAIMDASTLGKIDVRGPDAGEFLDRLYTNLMSTLKVGSARYGVMCGVDGMVFDDGTVIRARRRPLPLTTTTGNAADGPRLDGGVAPDRVAGAAACTCTSVTEQWATVAARRPALARRARPRSPPTSTCPTRRSRS